MKRCVIVALVIFMSALGGATSELASAQSASPQAVRKPASQAELDEIARLHPGIWAPRRGAEAPNSLKSVPQEPNPNIAHPELRSATLDPTGIAGTLRKAGCDPDWTFAAALWSNLDPGDVKKLHSLPKGTTIWYPKAGCEAKPAVQTAKASQLIFALERARKHSSEEAALRAELSNVRAKYAWETTQHVPSLESKLRAERARTTSAPPMTVTTVIPKDDPAKAVLLAQTGKKSLPEVGALVNDLKARNAALEEKVKQSAAPTIGMSLAKVALWAALALFAGVALATFIGWKKNRDQQSTFDAALADLKSAHQRELEALFNDNVIHPRSVRVDHFGKVHEFRLNPNLERSFYVCPMPNCGQERIALDNAQGHLITAHPELQELSIFPEEEIA